MFQNLFRTRRAWPGFDWAGGGRPAAAWPRPGRCPQYKYISIRFSNEYNAMHNTMQWTRQYNAQDNAMHNMTQCTIQCNRQYNTMDNIMLCAKQYNRQYHTMHTTMHKTMQYTRQYNAQDNTTHKTMQCTIQYTIVLKFYIPGQMWPPVATCGSG